MIFQGFPVNDSNPWANPAGTGLARSMVAFALQLDALGLLNEHVPHWVRIDAYPGSAAWDAGDSLDCAVMRRIARRAPVARPSPN